MSLLGINHVPSTPLWPQGNAHGEAFNQPLGKAIQTAHAERPGLQRGPRGPRGPCGPSRQK